MHGKTSHLRGVTMLTSPSSRPPSDGGDHDDGGDDDDGGQDIYTCMVNISPSECDHADLLLLLHDDGDGDDGGDDDGDDDDGDDFSP